VLPVGVWLRIRRPAGFSCRDDEDVHESGEGQRRNHDEDMEQQAKSQNVVLDEIVKRETLFPESQKVFEFRNEKIEGERATVEVKNSYGQWETWPFVFEESQWKIDKKGYADRLMQDIERENDAALEQIMNTNQAPAESTPPLP
jgi:hypothetical protein